MTEDCPGIELLNGVSLKIAEKFCYLDDTVGAEGVQLKLL